MVANDTFTARQRKQLQQLAEVFSLPEDPETLMAMVKEYANESNELKLLQGQKTLQRLIGKFRRMPQYREVCEAAQDQLLSIESRLAGEPAPEPEDDCE